MASYRLTTEYRHDQRLFRTPLAKAGMAGLGLVYLAAPLILDNFWMTVLIQAGIASIGALGLNVLLGYAGQLSLGHAFFYGVGAYGAQVFAGRFGLPFPLWLLAAASVGGFIGGVVGPLALRLRHQYLAIVSLALLFVGNHVFENWTSVTGGLTGIAVRAPVAFGGLDVSGLRLFGVAFSRNQGWLWFVWAVVAILALAVRNIVRSRPGRALQAIRDRDLAAEVIGVSQIQYKVGAFVVSSGYGAAAGALYAAYTRYVSPLDFSLFLSIQFLAMIVVGGVGSVAGSILGALFLTALPRVVEAVSAGLPFVAQRTGEAGITVSTLNTALFGLLIVVFLLAEPLGLIELWRRAKRYFASWPFSY